MSDLGLYFQAQAETNAARSNLEAASAKLKLARIHERLAEIKSQHEPLASLSEGDREKLYAAAFYVVIGRMPE